MKTSVAQIGMCESPLRVAVIPFDPTSYKTWVSANGQERTLSFQLLCRLNLLAIFALRIDFLSIVIIKRVLTPFFMSTPDI